MSDTDETTTDFQDDGVDIATSITSREFTFNDVVSLKSLYGIELEFYDSATSANVSIIPDGGNLEGIFTSIPTNLPQLVLPFVLDGTPVLGSSGTKRRGRDLSGRAPMRGVQVRISSSSGKLALRSVVLSSFLESYRPQVL